MKSFYSEKINGILKKFLNVSFMKVIFCPIYKINFISDNHRTA